MSIETKALRAVVADRLDVQWRAWAARHPHLAAAIDRIELSDTVVGRLTDDPDYQDAVRRGVLDEHTLREAARVLRAVDGLIGEVLVVGG